MANKQFRFAVPLMLLALGVSACKSVPQPDQVSTAGLRIDVLKLKNNSKRQRLDVRTKIWNDHDQRITFKTENVRMLCGGREVAAKPSLTSDRSPDVGPHSNKEFGWVFETGEEMGEGSYEIEIRDIMLGDLPLGDTARYAVNVGR